MRALSGILGGLWFALAVMVFGALRPGYSHLQQMMSELGERGAPFALGFNLLGFLPTGALLVLFGLQLAAWLSRQGLPRGPGLLIALHGLGMALAAWFSCDPGCNPPAPSPLQIGHNLLAAIKFPALIAAAGWWGVVLWRRGTHRGFAVYSLVTAVVALGLMGLFVQAVALQQPEGGWQRMFLGVLYGWVGVLSVWQWWGERSALNDARSGQRAPCMGKRQG